MAVSHIGTSALAFLAQRRTFLLALLGAPTVASAATAAQTPIYSQPFNGFSRKTLEQKMQELADREEIKELIARYAHRIAHNVTPADLFTDDGAFIVRIPNTPVNEARGREAIDKRFETIVSRTVPNPPMIHNHIIAIAGDAATGICSNELHMTDNNGQNTVRSGYYEDQFRRVNGRWKFAVRDAIFFN